MPVSVQERGPRILVHPVGLDVSRAPYAPTLVGGASVVDACWMRCIQIHVAMLQPVEFLLWTGQPAALRRERVNVDLSQRETRP